MNSYFINIYHRKMFVLFLYLYYLTIYINLTIIALLFAKKSLGGSIFPYFMLLFSITIIRKIFCSIFLYLLTIIYIYKIFKYKF